MPGLPPSAAALARGAPAALATLAEARAPWLIGVRHHSPALAAAMPALLEAASPDRIFLELPPEAAPWLAWLGHPEAVAPLALAVSQAGRGAAFYPFADFSPELVVLRWAAARGVPVEPFDLSLGERREGSGDGEAGDGEAGDGDGDGQYADGALGVHAGLQAQTGVHDGLALWDRLVEGPATGASPEAIRRAALLYGWALRFEGGRPVDLLREAHMRARLAASDAQRPVAVVGAFHAAALIEPGDADHTLDPLPRRTYTPGRPGPASVTSMLPYRFDLLDARSGYPAGVLDPGWHERMWRCHVANGDPLDVVAGTLVDVCRELRRARHVAGTPDASEALRVAVGLATLRGLPAPTRQELLEAIETALGQGELLGRGRALAKALERTLVGAHRGRLAPGTPRSGLLPAVERLLEDLRLPGPEADEPKVMRLDPLRSDLDRRRHVALRRLEALDVPYGACLDVGDSEDLLTHSWRLRWEPATEAALAAAAAFGATLPGAVTGLLRRERPTEDGPDDAPAANAVLAWVGQAAECGLGGLVDEGLADLGGAFVERARLAELVEAVTFVDRLGRGHVPGLPHLGSAPGAAGAVAAYVPAHPLGEVRAMVYRAGVAALDGLVGSTDPADVAALLGLLRLAAGESGDAGEPGPEAGSGGEGTGRLRWAVGRLAREGAPRISGAAWVAEWTLGARTVGALGVAVASAIEGATSEEGRRALGERLGGVLEAAGVRIEVEPALLDGWRRPLEALPDAAFLARLPALREGFEAWSPAARDRLLATLADAYDPDGLGVGASGAGRVDPQAALADAAGEAALVALGLGPVAGSAPGAGIVPAPAPPLGAPTPPGSPHPVPPPHAFDPLTRWRLVLGRDADRLPPEASRYAVALDELYGRGQGEGARADLGGTGTVRPTAREWSDELEALFGEEVRVEVVGRAAERGDAGALLLLDPEAVTPSVELLEQVLSLRGGLAEAQLTSLRRLCARVTEAVAKALAVRVRPALTGLSTERATRRPTDRLHLRRTLAANLRTARPGPDGVQIVPEHLHFRARARRTLDWQVQLVVDTSGSMEASVIHAAMMAAILAGLPAVDVSFFAFADEVVDLSERVSDPLALLLEVKVGGGTRIHRALRYARERVRVPQRTVLVLISDFEEGGSVGALLGEVRALAESGVRVLGLAALDEDAKPRFSAPIAAQVVAAGMPVAALTPLELARWLGEQIRGS